MAGWVLPDGHNDPQNKWTEEALAYNDDTLDGATTDMPASSWGDYLELKIKEGTGGIDCDKVRFWAAYMTGFIDQIKIQAFWDGSYHDVYEGSYTNIEWVEKDIDSGNSHTVTKAQVKFHNSFGMEFTAVLMEFNFNEVEAGEEKLLTATCSASSSITSSLTLGKIESVTATSATAANVPSTTLRLLYSITAHAPPAMSTIGNLSVVKSLSGTSSTTSLAQGSLSKIEALTATSSITSATAGSLTLGVIETLSGTSSVQTSISGTLAIVFSLTSSASASSATSGALTLGRIETLSAIVQIASTTQGSLTRGKVEALIAASSTVSSTQGILTVGKIELLSAIAQIQSAVSGSLTVTRIELLTALAFVTSLTSGSLGVEWPLTATTSAVSVVGPPTIIIIRATPSDAFLAEQAKRTNMPVKLIRLYENGNIHGLTSKFQSMGPIDRETKFKPGETNRLTISDQTLVMSNVDRYFSDLNPDSIFYDRDYAGQDVIKVFAGFKIDGGIELLQKAKMKLIQIELDTKQNLANLRCQDVFRDVFDRYVGMPDSEGVADPLVYSGSQSFKTIVDNLLQTHAGIPSADCDIEDVSLNFTDLTFEKKTIRECIQKLSEIARGSTIVMGDGKVSFRTFISEDVTIDYTLREGENFSLLRYTGQDYTLKVNKVVVIGAAVYAEGQIVGETGRTLKIENDLIATKAIATDVAADSLARFAVKPILVEMTAEYLPSLRAKDIVKIYESSSIANSIILQVRRLALDIVGFSTRLLLTSPDRGGRHKTWTTEADFDGGDLTNVYTPAGLGELQLSEGHLTGQGEWTFDVGVGYKGDWVYFNKEEA